MNQLKNINAKTKVSAAATDQLFVIDLLSNQLVFTERITRFTSQHVHRTFIDLLFDCSEQKEQRFASTVLEANRHTSTMSIISRSVSATSKSSAREQHKTPQITVA